MFGLTRNALRAPGARLTMPAKMMKLMPLPMPRSVISSPIHIRAMAPAVRVAIWVSVSKLDEVERAGQHALRVEERQHAVRLQDRHRDGQVAGVLVDLVAPELTLAAERLERRHDAAHQLHDDRGVDVRVHAQGDDREVREAAAREEVEQPDERVALRRIPSAAPCRRRGSAPTPGGGRRSAARGHRRSDGGYRARERH